MNMNFNTRISGEYRFVITSEDGTSRDTGWFPNLILNQGLDMLGGYQGNPMQYASIGTGTSTPIASQTSLDSPTAYSGAQVFVSVTSAGTPSYSTLHLFSYTFAQGAVVGNMSEIGTGKSLTGGNLFSRALIVDDLGNPTTITITAIDQLIVYYRVTLSPPLIDGVGTVVLNSITYNYTTRILNAASFGAIEYLLSNGAYYFSTIYSVATYGAGSVLSPITGNAPTGSTIFNSTNTPPISTSAYGQGNYYRDWVIALSPTQGLETGGIQGIKITSGGPWLPCRFQIVFNTPIPKVNTNSLTLTFRYSWGR